MFDFVLRFLEREENERLRQISFVLSLLVIANLTGWLYSLAFGEYEILRFTDIEGIVRFVFGGRSVLVLILFFTLWLALNSLLGYLLSIPHLFLSHKLWIFCSESVILLLKKAGRPPLILKTFLERIGFIAFLEDKLVPGTFIIELAKRVRKAFKGEPVDTSVKTTVPTTLVIQFILAYWLIVRRVFAPPITLEIVFHLFAATLIALDILLKSLLHMVVIHKDEVISLAPEEEQKA